MGGGSQTTSQNQNQIQGTLANPGLQNALSGVLGFDTSMMQNGLSQASQQQAMQANQNQDTQTINNIMKNLGPSSPNQAGLAEDLGKQATMGNAQTAADLAAKNQQVQEAGAQGVSQIGQLENPSTQYGNSSGSSTSTSNPGFGSFLGTLMGGLSSAGQAGLLSNNVKGGNQPGVTQIGQNGTLNPITGLAMGGV